MTNSSMTGVGVLERETLGGKGLSGSSWQMVERVLLRKAMGEKKLAPRALGTIRLNAGTRSGGGGWFSKGFETLGLGKPGLWGVSISLGMIGALLAVASNRDDLGYALGMVTFLGGAFGGSYVGRGVRVGLETYTPG